MKKVILVLMLILVSLSGNSIAQVSQLETLVGSLESAQEEKGYFVSKNDQGLYQSTNRSNNINFTYYKNGFIAQTSSQKEFLYQQCDTSIISPAEMYRFFPEWKVELKVKKINNESISFSDSQIKAEENKCFVVSDKLSVNYQNTKEGMRQDFIIPQKTSTSEKLTLELEAETDLKCLVNSQAITFINTVGEVMMQYSSLKVFDANGTILNASFKKVSDDSFIIDVDDKGAVYPITIDPISTSPTWTSISNQAGSGFGFTVASAGDVNNDGYDDIIIGAPFYDNGQVDEGRAFVFHGSASGIQSVIKWTGESNQNDGRFGCSVSSAGDVNNDGYDDVIVGADQYQSAAGFTGRTYIYFGSANGLMTTPSVVIDGNQVNARFGYSVSSAGDVNNDGFCDIVIGAPLYDNGQVDEGRAFVLYGSSSGPNTVNMSAESNMANAFFGCVASTAGDVNNDGYDDVIVGAMTYKDSPNYISQGKAFVYHGSPTGLSTIPNWKMENQYTWFTYIGISVSTAGDVNNDGYDDVIIGATGFDNPIHNYQDEGKIYVYYGSPIGLSPIVSWSMESFQSFSRFGNSVASAGDVNNDGYDDIIIGSYMSDYGQTDEGSAALYCGSALGLTTAYKVLESNQAQATYGNSVASAGDVNNDGYDDLIIGSYLYNNGGTTTGKAFVYHGASGGPKILTMKNFIQGLYNPSLNNTYIDSMCVFLRTSVPPFAIVDSAKTLINVNGVGVYSFISSNTLNNTNYYLEVKHRNSITTWSKTPQMFVNNIKTYSFNTAATQAYGNNMVSVDTSPLTYAMYSGDINQDRNIDLDDVIFVYNNTIDYSDLNQTDLNGDGLNDLNDILIAYNNSQKFISAVRP